MANKWLVSLAIVAVALPAFGADDENSKLYLCPEVVAGILERLPAATATLRERLVRTFMADEKLREEAEQLADAMARLTELVTRATLAANTTQPAPAPSSVPKTPTNPPTTAAAPVPVPPKPAARALDFSATFHDAV